MFVESLDLLLADSITVRNLRIVEESHKGTRNGPSDKRSGILIVIAGPYASGTDGDPELMRRNLRRLEQAAWPLFKAGHLPMIGEWVALPVLDSAGATRPTDPLAQDVLYPTAERLLQRCDALPPTRRIPRRRPRRCHSARAEHPRLLQPQRHPRRQRKPSRNPTHLNAVVGDQPASCLPQVATDSRT